MQNSDHSYDVAIIGGGPAGATLGSLLLKYQPSLKVLILERESFPRDHIGESLLPPVSGVLDEMGCWQAIEAANFPIKIGATYRWGKRPELWDFDFLPTKDFREEPRPAPYEGQRRSTAFQVDRCIYDKILLDHAASLGCEVREETQVAQVILDGDTVQCLRLSSGEEVRARYYVDASGNSGLMRRALDIKCDFPSSLQNIAIYDYWQNADWAVNIGVGGTRIQVRSLGYGWLWFIPLGPSRTSIGLVIPVAQFKKMGKRPAELYEQAVRSEETISSLLTRAHSEGKLQTTKDWSFLAERHAGPNWFLVGEAGGFADPILSAGVTMAHVGARRLACTLLELDRGNFDPQWLKSEFEHQQKQVITTHIRFGDFWYTANKQLTDLKEFTSELADEVGLDLDPEAAWDWISRGGFIQEDLSTGMGGFSLNALTHSRDYLTDLASESPLKTNNVLELNLEGADQRDVAFYMNGRVVKANCYFRGTRILPMKGPYEFLVKILRMEREAPTILSVFSQVAASDPNNPMMADLMTGQALEAMIHDGWVKASYDPKLPLVQFPETMGGFHWNKDTIATE